MLLLLAVAGTAHAAGTPAGTPINNTAVVTYTLAGAAVSVSASAAPVLVSRVLSLSVAWQDSTPVPVASPDSLRPLTFVVTNTGNSADTARLTRDNLLAGDQFDPADASQGAIWIESGIQPGFQSSGPTADIAYVPGSNDLVLPVDGSRTVYLASAIPASQATGATGRAALNAVSTLAMSNPTPGAQVAVAGGVPVIVGPGRGRASATGVYLVSNVAIGIVKSVTSVVDPTGGSRVMPGSVVTYRLLVTAAGSGTANGIAVSDPLPPALGFVPGSITVDGVPRTDAADADDSSFGAGTVQTVFPALSAPATRAIEFKATVR